MILSKFVKVKIHPKMISYYKNLGYNIPMFKPYHNRNRLTVKHGTEIEVKVSDLPKNSNVKVLCKCDNPNCQSFPILLSYQHYNKKINGKYYCLSCAKTGRKHSEKTKNKIKDWYKNHPLTKSERIKLSQKFSGKNNPMWNPELTDEDRKIIRSKYWSQKVKERDDYTCRCCGHIGKQNDWFTNAHHINSFANFKEQRTSVENGITLCKECHISFHKMFGKKTDDKDLEAFLKII